MAPRYLAVRPFSWLTGICASTRCSRSISAIACGVRTAGVKAQQELVREHPARHHIIDAVIRAKSGLLGSEHRQAVRLGWLRWAGSRRERATLVRAQDDCAARAAPHRVRSHDELAQQCLARYRRDLEHEPECGTGFRKDHAPTQSIVGYDVQKKMHPLEAAPNAVHCVKRPVIVGFPETDRPVPPVVPRLVSDRPAEKLWEPRSQQLRSTAGGASRNGSRKQLRLAIAPVA